MQCAVLLTNCVNKGKTVEKKLEGIEFQHWRNCYLFLILKAHQYHWNYKKKYLRIAT